MSDPEYLRAAHEISMGNDSAPDDAMVKRAMEEARGAWVRGARADNPLGGAHSALVCLWDHVTTLTAKLEAERARAEKGEEMAFVPGRWRCAKCALVLTSTNLHVADGGMSANNEPHVCPNNCGPMWRVSERDERKEAQRSFIDLHEKSTRETARADAAVAEAKALREALFTIKRGHTDGDLGGATWRPLHQNEIKAIVDRATLAQPADGGR